MKKKIWIYGGKSRAEAVILVKLWASSNIRFSIFWRNSKNVKNTVLYRILFGLWKRIPFSFYWEVIVRDANCPVAEPELWFPSCLQLDPLLFVLFILCFLFLSKKKKHKWYILKNNKGSNEVIQSS